MNPILSGDLPIITSTERLTRQFPDVVRAVHQIIRENGFDPADYEFTAASLTGNTLEGAYRPRHVIAAFRACNFDVCGYTWFKFVNKRRHTWVVPVQE